MQLEIVALNVPGASLWPAPQNLIQVL